MCSTFSTYLFGFKGKRNLYQFQFIPPFMAPPVQAFHPHNHIIIT